MLIGSELAQLSALKSEALSELDACIALYRQRHPRGLEYFGLHSRELRMPYRTMHELYWRDQHPAEHERKGVVISVSREDEFLEVVNAVLAKMQWIRGRQKSFQFAPPLERSA